VIIGSRDSGIGRRWIGLHWGPTVELVRLELLHTVVIMGCGGWIQGSGFLNIFFKK
jgi:hypothetical protein